MQKVAHVPRASHRCTRSWLARLTQTGASGRADSCKTPYGTQESLFNTRCRLPPEGADLADIGAVAADRALEIVASPVDRLADDLELAIRNDPHERFRQIGDADLRAIVTDVVCLAGHTTEQHSEETCRGISEVAERTDRAPVAFHDDVALLHDITDEIGKHSSVVEAHP